MKRILVGLTALLLAGHVNAQTAAALVAPLHSGEVALHIAARGEVTTRADRISVAVTVTGRGPTVPEARAAADAAAARLTTALTAVGVDRAAITQTSAGSKPGSSNPFNAVAAMMGGGDGGHPAARTAVTTMQVAVPDRAMLDRVTQVVAAHDDASAATPKPMLRDEAAAYRGAVSVAVTKARQDADDYAAALGLKVIRVAAVSNSGGLADGIEVFTTIVAQFQDKGSTPDTVTTAATATVDFVLGPR